MTSFLQKICEYWRPVVSEYPKLIESSIPETKATPLDGRSELFKAIENKDLEKLKLLIEKGVDVNVLDDGCQTPLHHALQCRSSLEMIRELIDAGAFINSKNYYGDTPLHHSVATGSEDRVRILMHSGADVSIQNNYSDTPLHYALLYERKGIADYLRTKGAKL